MSTEEKYTERQSALERYGRPDTPMLTDRDRVVAGLVEMWMGADLDYLITVSFKEETYTRLHLKNPDRMKAFVKDRLAAAGYWGPYVLVVHDTNGSSYWHPHLIIKDNGLAKRVEREFHRFGDLGTRYNGPIKEAGSFAYHARRATELWPVDDNWEFRPCWSRRPRPRGRGSRQLQQIGDSTSYRVTSCEESARKPDFCKYSGLRRYICRRSPFDVSAGREMKTAP